MSYWSWILAAVSVIGLWTTGSKKRWGWLISLGSEGLWLSYAVVTRQYGFIAMSVAFAVVHIRNWLKWKEKVSCDADEHYLWMQAGESPAKPGRFRRIFRAM